MWPYDDDPSKKKRKLGSGGSEKEPQEGHRSLCDPAKLTPSSLREAALRYLDRQDGAVEQVRRSLRRRVHRYGDDESRGPALSEIDAVLSRLVESNFLNDERFAKALALSTRRKGASLSRVRHKLQTRGLSPADIDSAITFASEEEELDDEACALIYAKKRRLKDRYDLKNTKERQKALASLARQGFSFDVAKAALGL